jgi:hypothetical protein
LAGRGSTLFDFARATEVERIVSAARRRTNNLWRMLITTPCISTHMTSKAQTEMHAIYSIARKGAAPGEPSVGKCTHDSWVHYRSQAKWIRGSVEIDAYTPCVWTSSKAAPYLTQVPPSIKGSQFAQQVTGPKVLKAPVKHRHQVPVDPNVCGGSTSGGLDHAKRRIGANICRDIVANDPAAIPWPLLRLPAPRLTHAEWEISRTARATIAETVPLCWRAAIERARQVLVSRLLESAGMHLFLE